MKTHKITLFVALLLMILGSLNRLNGQWKKYVIDDSLATAVTIDTADLDGDNKPDLVVNSFYNSDIFWYQNNYPSWIKHTVDEFASGVSFAWCGDFDGDGTADIAANLLLSNKIVWYENNLPTWTIHSIDNKTDNSDFTLVSDINGDGVPDVITCGNISDGGDLVWYEYQEPLWIEHIIEPGSVKWGALNISDIDGDGMSDVVASMVDADILVWYKNEGNGITWTKDTIDENLANSLALNSGDIDGDGTLDLVATTGYAYLIGSEVVWYEQSDSIWIKHVIDNNLLGAGWSVMKDMNGDERMDVVVAAFKERSIVWYEQTDSGWIKHIIDDNILDPRIFLIMDVDGDQFDDIILSSKTSLVWYRHPGNTAYAISFEVSPNTFQPPDDTLTIRANLHNPESHPMNVFAVVEGEQSQFVDTIPLFDDGAHEDGDLADHVWANIKLMTGFPEDVYEVELMAYDSTTGKANDYLPPDRFITLGPVSLENYSISSSHQVFSPGELIDVTLTLRNNSTTAVAPDIHAKLESLNPNVMVSVLFSSFGNIAAGESATSDKSFQIRISDTSPVNVHLPVAVNIYYEFQPYWRDTLYIFVYEEQPVNIPDTAFLHALIDEGVDTNGDSLISYGEAEAITELGVIERGISDLTGIEAFINLDTLWAHSNLLTSIDLSALVKLTDFRCYENQLTDLDVSKNTALVTLICPINHLTELDISNNPNLVTLRAHSNNLTQLDVSNNPELTELFIFSNELSELDLSMNKKLEALRLSENPINTLDIRTNKSLKLIAIENMPTLSEVCVWEIPFPPAGVEVNTSGSPNVCFQTDCNGDCSNVGIEDFHESGISVYPNPTNSFISIKTDKSDHYSIVITSMNGQLVFNKRMQGITYQIDFSSFQKGVYFITIRNEYFVTTRKIIKL